MLISRIPSIFLGALLGAAVSAMGFFAIGFGIGSSQYPSQFAQSQGSQDGRGETGNDKEDETLWHWMTHDASGFFTLWLVIVGVGQLILFLDQLRLIRESLDDASIQADLTKRTLVMTLRPRLRARNITVRHPTIIPYGPAQLFTKNKPLMGQFYIANIGGTPAILTEGFAMTIQSRHRLPMERPYEGSDGNLLIPRSKLHPGKSFCIPFNSSELIGDGAETIGTKIPHKLRLFIMGWIEYKDDIGIVRRTAFCREFKGTPLEGGGFLPVKNPDYEHEE